MEQKLKKKEGKNGVPFLFCLVNREPAASLPLVQPKLLGVDWRQAVKSERTRSLREKKKRVGADVKDVTEIGIGGRSWFRASERASG